MSQIRNNEGLENTQTLQKFSSCLLKLTNLSSDYLACNHPVMVDPGRIPRDDVNGSPVAQLLTFHAWHTGDQ